MLFMMGTAVVAGLLIVLPVLWIAETVILRVKAREEAVLQVSFLAAYLLFFFAGIGVIWSLL